MEGSGAIEEAFGGEVRSFRVALAELRAIQIKCDAGPPELARRMARGVHQLRAHPKATLLERAAIGLGDWNVDDVRETVFQGLLGGGMSPNEAANLVRKWIDARGFQGLVENLPLALTLLIAGVATPEDDPVPGEPKARVKRVPRAAK